MGGETTVGCTRCENPVGRGGLCEACWVKENEKTERFREQLSGLPNCTCMSSLNDDDTCPIHGSMAQIMSHPVTEQVEICTCGEYETCPVCLERNRREHAKSEEPQPTCLVDGEPGVDLLATLKLADKWGSNNTPRWVQNAINSAIARASEPPQPGIDVVELVAKLEAMKKELSQSEGESLSVLPVDTRRISEAIEAINVLSLELAQEKRDHFATKKRRESTASSLEYSEAHALRLLNERDEALQQLAQEKKETGRRDDEAKRYWSLLCDTAEALGLIFPETCPYLPGHAKKVMERVKAEHDALAAQLSQSEAQLESTLNAYEKTLEALTTNFNSLEAKALQLTATLAEADRRLADFEDQKALVDILQADKLALQTERDAAYQRGRTEAMAGLSEPVRERYVGDDAWELCPEGPEEPDYDHRTIHIVLSETENEA